MLEDRKAEVLRVLVEEHIRTGEPVSSKTIAEISGLGVSAATIRNDLAVLEQEGYVVQPHTSAGRVPTAKAYRYYVDHLEVQSRPRLHRRISAMFGEMNMELSKLLRATSDLLAELTELPAVVVAPGIRRDRIKSLHAVQLTTEQMLVVVITEAGRVVQHRGRLTVPVGSDLVETAQRFVAAELVGQELGSVREIPPERLEELDEPMRALVDTLVDCVHAAASSGNEMFVAGAQRMPTAWDDASTISRVLEILQREAELMKIIAGASALTVQLGTEMLEHEPLDLAVVSRTFDASGEAGSVGVIGPMRMNYKRAIQAVEEVSRELESQIGSTVD
ncbi:MAG: heat-inducible transcriptional repressor HrcA [Actinomycetes bacterium]|jgi:heat-inducible transcriptional repressor